MQGIRCIGILLFLISINCVYLDCEWCTEADTNLFGTPNGVDMSGVVKGCVKKGTCPKQNVKKRSVKIILILYFNNFDNVFFQSARYDNCPNFFLNAKVMCLHKMKLEMCVSNRKLEKTQAKGNYLLISWIKL